MMGQISSPRSRPSSAKGRNQVKYSMASRLVKTLFTPRSSADENILSSSHGSRNASRRPSSRRPSREEIITSQTNPAFDDNALPNQPTRWAEATAASSAMPCNSPSRNPSMWASNRAMAVHVDAAEHSTAEQSGIFIDADEQALDEHRIDLPPQPQVAFGMPISVEN